MASMRVADSISIEILERLSQNEAVILACKQTVRTGHIVLVMKAP